MSHTAICAAMIALSVIVTGAVFGKTMVEKLITELLMPLGLVWLMLIVVAWIAIVSGQRLIRFVAVVGLLLMTVFGNSWVANQLIQSLEQPYQRQVPLKPGDVDTVVLLGGSTTTDLSGQARLSNGGDRVAVAAGLYHAADAAGVPLKILCTGEQAYRSDQADMDPKDESKSCLIALGVDVDAISTLPGINTYQEMQHLREWIDQQPAGHRVGIITSAWHLPRAMRLAQTRGIDATPIPSDFRSGFFSPSVGLVVPTVSGLQKSTAAVKEYLARLVKR